VPEVVSLDLIGVSEAAGMLRIGGSALSERRSRDKTFPKPVAELACGPIWPRSQIAHYRDEEDRLGPRGWYGRRLDRRARRRTSPPRVSATNGRNLFGSSAKRRES